MNLSSQILSAVPSGIWPTSSGRLLIRIPARMTVKQYVYSGKTNPRPTPTEAGNEPADERRKGKSGGAAGGEKEPHSKRASPDEPIVDDGGNWQIFTEGKADAGHKTEKEINVPEFAYLRHTQKTERRNDIAEDDISAGAEPGDRKARERCQHAADNEEKSIGAGKG